MPTIGNGRAVLVLFARRNGLLPQGVSRQEMVTDLRQAVLPTRWDRIRDKFARLPKIDQDRYELDLFAEHEAGATVEAVPEAGGEGITTGRGLRDALQRKYRISSDFDSFVLDYFPDVYGKFTNNMDRTARTNLLLTLVDAEMVRRYL